jgi:hypothetical protein
MARRSCDERPDTTALSATGTRSWIHEKFFDLPFTLGEESYLARFEFMYDQLIIHEFKTMLQYTL